MRWFRNDEGTSRMSITIGEETKEAIVLLADELNISQSGAINHLISQGLAIEAARNEGANFFAQMPDGQVYLLAPTRDGWGLIEIPQLPPYQNYQGLNGYHDPSYSDE